MFKSHFNNCLANYSTCAQILNSDLVSWVAKEDAKFKWLQIPNVQVT